MCVEAGADFLNVACLSWLHIFPACILTRILHICRSKPYLFVSFVSLGKWATTSYEKQQQLRLEGIPALNLWGQVVEIFSPEKPTQSSIAPPAPELRSVFDVDYVPPALPKSGRAKLLILEGNEPVIKMTIKGRSPYMKYVGRVHRVDLD